MLGNSFVRCEHYRTEPSSRPPDASWYKTSAPIFCDPFKCCIWLDSPAAVLLRIGNLWLNLLRCRPGPVKCLFSRRQQTSNPKRGEHEVGPGTHNIPLSSVDFTFVFLSWWRHPWQVSARSRAESKLTLQGSCKKPCCLYLRACLHMQTHNMLWPDPVLWECAKRLELAVGRGLCKPATLRTTLSACRLCGRCSP